MKGGSRGALSSSHLWHSGLAHDSLKGFHLIFRPIIELYLILLSTLTHLPKVRYMILLIPQEIAGFM